jgi:hypothetical protein
VLVACAAVAGCRRGEPPTWDAGAGASLAVSPLPAASTSGATPSVSVDGGARVTTGPSSAPSAPPMPAAPPMPSASLAPAPSTAPATPAAPSGEESGKLPQTRDRPAASGEAFDARVHALWDAIVLDDPDRATPFFFPLSAYQQVKAIANPSADWKRRLVAHYVRDIHAAHAKLGDKATHARFTGVTVPMDRARWVEPNEEYNRLGYYRVYGTQLRGESDGAPITVDVTSLISWRGEWFCVHLTGVK